MFSLVHLAAHAIPTENIENTPAMRTLAQNICFDITPKIAALNEEYQNEIHTLDKIHGEYNAMITLKNDIHNFEEYVEIFKKISRDICVEYNRLEDIGDISYDSNPWYAYYEYFIFRIVTPTLEHFSSDIREFIQKCKGILKTIEEIERPDEDVPEFLEELASVFTIYEGTVINVLSEYNKNFSFEKCMKLQKEYTRIYARWEKQKKQQLKNDIAFFNHLKDKFTPMYTYIPDVCKKI